MTSETLVSNGEPRMCTCVVKQSNKKALKLSISPDYYDHCEGKAWESMTEDVRGQPTLMHIIDDAKNGFELIR